MPVFLTRVHSLEAQNNRFIFYTDFSTDDITRSQKENFKKKLINIGESEAPPTSFRYERIGSVDVIRTENEFRAFTVMCEKCSHYNIIVVLDVTGDHDYSNISARKSQAKTIKSKFNSLSSKSAVESELSNYSVFTTEDLKSYNF